jgi:AICAR transformylase/IMP cyclohydrolase PurH
VAELERFVCAFDEPYEGASSFLGERRVHLKGCVMGCDEGEFHPFQSGLVFRIHAGKIYIAAPGGYLLVSQVTDADGTTIIDTIELGMRFTTPVKHLEAAAGTRAVYTATGIKST